MLRVVSIKKLLFLLLSCNPEVNKKIDLTDLIK